MTTDGARLQQVHLHAGEARSSATRTATRCLKAAASDQVLLVGGSLLASFVLFQMLKSTPRPPADDVWAKPRPDGALEPPDPELGAWAE